jgi:hypothetical protein
LKLAGSTEELASSLETVATIFRVTLDPVLTDS